MSKDTAIKVSYHILISAMRYAMGRYTYAPLETIEAIKDNWPNVPEGGRYVIRRDLVDFIGQERHRPQPFDGIDLKAWEEFLKWIDQNW